MDDQYNLWQNFVADEFGPKFGFYITFYNAVLGLGLLLCIMFGNMFV